jgi:hypothetical protein
VSSKVSSNVCSKESSKVSSKVSSGVYSKVSSRCLPGRTPSPFYLFIENFIHSLCGKEKRYPTVFCGIETAYNDFK